MAKQVIDIGISGNDGTGDSIRESFRKVNENFDSLFAIFGIGGTIKFKDLDDGTEYNDNQIIMANQSGSTLTARDLVGGPGIEINTDSDTEVVITASVANLAGDLAPSLGGPLNVNNLAIGRIPSPSSDLVDAFNSVWSPLGQPTTFDQLPVNVGYANQNYVRLTTDGVIGTEINGIIIPGPLRVREEPSAPQTDDKDYSSSLTSNYLATEAMRREDTVYRGGDTMTGPLVLSDHPAPFTNYGTLNGSDDLQAASKFYVDSQVYSSNINLYVSSTSGDDLQLKSPVGKEGRFWNYAYKSIGAAALQAESLINLSNQEPGPYRQRITYTIDPDSYFSTIDSVELSDGNSTVASYQDAYNLLQKNREFIQAETIAYINKRYVNEFTYDKAKCSRDVKYILDAIGYDLVLETTYNSYLSIIQYFNSTSTKVLSDQLIQTVNAIKYARDQLIDFSYDEPNVVDYVERVVDALCYDLVFQSNYQSLQVALDFERAGTDLSKSQMASILEVNPINILDATGNGVTSILTFSPRDSIPFKVGSTIIVSGMVPSTFNGTFVVTDCTLSTVAFYNSVDADSSINGTVDRFNLTNKILSLTELLNSISATNFIKENVSLITNILLTGNLPEVSIPSLATTAAGISSARTLLFNNIEFIQAEIIAYLNAEYPAVTYSKVTCRRDVEYIVWSLIYDFMYEGNSQSVYAAKQYWNGSLRNIQELEVAPTLAAIEYINGLAQAIITNGSLTTIYQQTIRQYRNDTLTGGSAASLSISANIATIKDIIENHSSPVITLPDVTNSTVSLQSVRTAILIEKTTFSQDMPGFIDDNYPVINDPAVSAQIIELFDLIIDPLVLGVETIVDPTYVSPSGLGSGYTHAREALLANLDFIADETTAWVDAQGYPGFSYDAETCKRDVKYILFAICYDITYDGNSASVLAGQKYWYEGLTNVPGQQDVTIDAINFARELAVSVSQNTLVTPVYSSTTQVTNGAWTNGSIASSKISQLFNTIVELVNENGTPTVTYPDLTPFDADIKAIQEIILDNKNSIANNTIVFLDTNYRGGFNYDESICYRDVGLIIDAMSIDLITDGTWQSIYAGKSYYKNASAKAIAIGTQYTETLDGIEFAKSLGLQVLNKSTATRYQELVTQITEFQITDVLPTSLIGIAGASLTPTPASDAITDFEYNMDTLISIINYGVGSAPTPVFGTGIWNVSITNGGNGFVDQGAPGNNDIIPAKVVVGISSNAYGSIVKYQRNYTSGLDNIQIRLTKPGFYTLGEQIEFGETVKDLNITIFVESGVYYEDYPIRLSANCSIKGDDFRRVIVRPRDRISQSPWRKVFFYRDAVIDALEIGLVDYNGTSYATDVDITLSGKTGSVSFTLASGQAPISWIGKILADSNTINGNEKRGKAIVSTVSGNVVNCNVIYPFENDGLIAAGDWFLFGSINYGRHYLTDPLDISSTAKNNKDIDAFLCNDATRINNMTFQGHGGFAMVLDPEGQIKTKSPYGQVCSSFSQSNNRIRFAGGQFVDGFAGRLVGTITAIADSGITVTVQGEVNSGLDIRPPQPPCAFYVEGYRYQINDIVSFDAATATVVLTLDTETPYNVEGSYNNTKCARDVGLILDAVGYDIVLGSNYQAVTAGLSYLRSYSSVVVNSQTPATVAGINKARDLALAEIDYSPAETAVTDLMRIITDIISNGISAAPSITYPNPVGVNATDDIVKAKNLLQDNREFVQYEISSWIAENYSIKLIPNYSARTCQRDVGYIIDAITYDMFYGGNSQTKYVAESYYRDSVSYIAGEESVHVAAFGRLKTVLQQIIEGTTVTKSVGNNKTQITSNIPVTPAGYVSTVGTLTDIIIDYVLDGDYDASVSTTYPTILGQDSDLLTARTDILAAKNSIKSSVISFLNSGAELKINIEAGGNKSMLANDFAMINDLGYGIVCTNGGVSEQVSTFTYYCHSHYWANNGGQIRSVAGSNSHGNYGLRATGYDVTEKPDAVELANDMVQTAHIYKRGKTATDMDPTVDPSFAIWIIDYSYPPMGSSEIEIDHSLSGGGVSRYPITNVEHTDITFNGQNVLKLNLSTDGRYNTISTGLEYPLYDGQLVSLRVWDSIKFLDIANVQPTRPSTALQYDENLGDIYRILAYTLAESTGEFLPDNQSVLQGDSAFNYYKFVVDTTNMLNADPDDPTKTQGASVGDTKIAVQQISRQQTIDQINKGIYIFAWSGRVHRVIQYIVPQFIATGSFYSGNTSSTTLVVSNVSGLIEDGDIVTGTGFDGSQIVQSSTYDEATSRTTVILSDPPGTTPSGTITFGIALNGYIEIDSTPIANNSADGTNVNSMSFKSISSQPGSSVAKIVKFDIPYNKNNVYPAVDSFLTIANNTNANYNGTHQVSGILSQTQITVSDTTGLEIGMVATSVVNVLTPTGASGNTTTATLTFENQTSIPYATGTIITVTGMNPSGYNGTYTVTNGTTSSVSYTNSTTGSIVTAGSITNPVAHVIPNTVITSIDSTTQFTVSPACWIPLGGTVSATAVASVDQILISNSGSGYESPPTITISGGGATTQAIATCTISNGSIDNVTVVSAGYGYTSTPTVEVSSGNAELTAVLTESATTNVIASAGSSTITMDLSYASDPGTSGTATTVTSSGNLITLSTVSNMSINNPITFTGTAFGNLVSGTTYYILTIVGSQITVSTSLGGSVFNPGSESGTMTFYTPSFAHGTRIASSSYSSKTPIVPGDTAGEYSVVLSFGSTTAPTTDNYYRIVGNSNELYNGIWLCTASSTTSITLTYPYDPGTFGSGTTSITKEITSGSSNTIGIAKMFDSTSAYTLRLGFAGGTTAQITTRISTCRATGHDFLDIGTGSYSTTNYPYQIYGNPAQSKLPQNEVVEDGVGRVFYVSTDQDGIFRVGRFFTVDQGTGTVTFSANIALSNLDGLGFKKGVVVTEFSTDISMINNASDTVPVQSAVRGYIDKRLGIDHGGTILLSGDLIGPGYLPLNGDLAMKSDLNLANNSITNVATSGVTLPISPSIVDPYTAANKAYVDQQIALHDQLSEMSDVTIGAPANSQLLVYTNSTNKWKNATLTGNVTISYNGTTLTSSIASDQITNSMIKSDAAIVQSKLSLNAAATRATATGITQADLGLASVNSAMFTSTNGWISLLTSTSSSTGVTLDKLQYISNNTLLGNRSGSAASPTEITPAQVVTDGDGIKNASFNASGLMVTTYDGVNTTNNTYSIIGTTTNGGANKIVKTGASGEIDATSLKVDGYKIIDTSSTSVVFTTPGGFDFLSVSGSTSGNTVSTLSGTLDIGSGTIKATAITTGAATTLGNLTGLLRLTSSSVLDLNTNSVTLKAYNLTTDGTDAGNGTIQGNWTLSGSSKLQATYADLAEYYEGDRVYEPGTVLVFGGNKEVTASTIINDTRVAGVITTNPAYVMNAEQVGQKVCIALVGRTPCKVIGRVKKGDLLTTSNTPGYAIKALTPTLGSIIGKALEDKDTGEAGVIEIAVGRA